MAAKVASAGVRSVSKSRMLIGLSMPLVGFSLVPIAHAGSKKVHPRELDIYWEPRDAVIEFVEVEPSPLEKKVSKTRKFAWGFADNIKNGVNEMKTLYETTENKTVEFGKLIQTDRTLQVKVGVITTGALVGVVLAGRGRRPFKRFFYTVGLGTAAAAVCYPKCALSVTQNGYRRIKSFVHEQQKKYFERKQDKKPSATEEFIREADVDKPLQTSSEEKIYEEVVPYKENLVEEPAVVEEKNFNSVRSDENVDQPFWKKIPFLSQLFGEDKSKKREATKLGDKEEIQQTEQVELIVDKKDNTQDVVQGDHGQSIPDDKDMYSTRS